ncbi:serine hydrolase [Catenulispora sp. NL8]|uniref:Serine hydrolase n=1 Tax=Catenulispora pinistramenti TaxID=2705254 RepID=A0ABS5KQ62_9ACTN|nr:serine hydrolase [Catenulispora pinistramenti]MBS2548193.1 serine hydrolase [Catenulispora pinistramenti]
MSEAVPPSGTAVRRAVPRINAAFADAGVTGRLHALDIDTGASVSVAATHLTPTSSLHKVCLLATLYREAAAGRLDRTRQIDIPAAERTPGLSGLAVMRDAVRMSLRDLATLVVAVSDSAAADVLWREVGFDAVNRTMAELGLTDTIAVHDMAAIREALRAHPDLTDPAALADISILNPARTNRSTARQMAELFAAVWREEVCAGEPAEELRALLGLQAWTHRMASGFPFDDVRVSGKTATLPTLRHEAGVVEYPDGGRYAVAVFTRAASAAAILPAADAVIGTAARIAVDALRSV